MTQREMILALLSQRGRMSTSEIAAAINASRKAVGIQLLAMCRKGMVEVCGTAQAKVSGTPMNVWCISTSTKRVVKERPVPIAHLLSQCPSVWHYGYRASL